MKPSIKPLDGCLIVSIEQALAAPLCTAKLIEAGARVIKVERASGDFSRGYDTAAKGESSYFTWTNQGKQSIILDFKAPADKQFLENMISKADIFIQNLAPGAMARAGFSSKSLRNKYPKLITCDISGYGEHDTLAEMKAYDFLVQAECGLVGISGGVNEIGRIGVSICDIGAGMTAHAAILEAILLREKTSLGSSLKISLFDVAADWMAVPLIHNDYGKAAPVRQGLKHPTIAPYGAYKTLDNIDVIISIQNEREWHRFCKNVLKDDTIAKNILFKNNNARVKNYQLLDEHLNRIIHTLSSDEFQKRLTQSSIAFGRINSVEDLSHHIALRRKQVANSNGDLLEIPASPIRWVGRNPEATMAAPKLGEHSKQLRKEFEILGAIYD